MAKELRFTFKTDATSEELLAAGTAIFSFQTRILAGIKIHEAYTLALRGN